MERLYGETDSEMASIENQKYDGELTGPYEVPSYIGISCDLSLDSSFRSDLNGLVPVSASWDNFDGLDTIMWDFNWKENNPVTSNPDIMVGKQLWKEIIELDESQVSVDSTLDNLWNYLWISKGYLTESSRKNIFLIENKR